MKSEKALRRLLFSISTLEDLGEVLSSRNNYEENIRLALYSLMGSLPVSRGAIFLYRRRRQSLALEASRGMRLPDNLRIPLTARTARTNSSEGAFLRT